MNRTIRHAGPILGLSLAALFCGCERPKQKDADRIEILAGDNQTGAPRTFLAPLEVRVLGPRRTDFLGRKREREPAAGVPVTFKVDDLRKDRFKRLLAEGNGEKKQEPRERQVGGENDEAGSATGGAVAKREEPPGGTLHPLLYHWRSGTGDKPLPAREPGRTEIIVLTDDDGVARVDVELGDLNGAWRVEAEPVQKPGEKVHFRLINGVERVLPDGREAHVESDLHLEMRLREWDSEAGSTRALKDREVVFRLVDEPRGAEGTADLKDRVNSTDDDGRRFTRIILGERPGVYRVLGEILPAPEDRWPWRGVIFTVVATNWVEVGLRFFSGVFLFVIGVRLLGSGCLLLTSPHMHLPIGPWTRNRLSGFLGGVVAGSLFQSASLVTSYLASLSNSGLLRAQGALAIILGANIGGTVLCQILAQDVDALASPLLVIGTLLFLARRSTQLRSWAWIFVGSGLIVISWSVLNESIQTAALSDSFKLTVGLGHYSSPVTRYLVFFLVAAAGAFVLRTSNLIVVLAMLLILNTVVPPATAVPLVLGANLGAPLMVFVLTRRKRNEARKVALLNLLFQFFGCAVALVIGLITVDGTSLFMLLIEQLAPGTLLSPLPANIPQHVAGAHTAYNLVTAMVFLIVPAALLRPLRRIMPESTTDTVRPIHLEENLKSVPALALRQTTAEVVYMTEICRKAVAEAFDSFRYNDLTLSDQVVRREQVLSDMHREVSRYLVEVCENQLTHHDATQLEILQSAAESVSRIGSSAEALRELTARKLDEKFHTSEEIERDLGEVYDLVVAQFGNILTLLDERDVRTEENAVKMVERLAKYSSRIQAHWRQGHDDGLQETLPVATHQQLILHQEAFAVLFSIAADLAHIAQRMRILAPQR